MINPSNRKKFIVGLASSFLCFVLIFVAGFFFSKTNLECVASYAAKVADNTSNKTICLSVERGPESNNLPDSYQEFRTLSVVFKQKMSFASAINADKRHMIYIENQISDNLSFVNIGPIGSSEYGNHYVHYIYPIEIMFSDLGHEIYDVSRYVAYISQTHANKLLEYRGVLKNSDGQYCEDDYKSLIKSKVEFIIDGMSFDFAICNIYYPFNYYYEGLTGSIGDFVLTSYYLPNDLSEERQNLYYMGNQTYQNMYFMDYLNSVYPQKNYNLKVVQYNIDEEINEDYLLSFYYSQSLSQYEWLSCIILMLAGILLITSVYFYSKMPISTMTNIYILACLLVSICPYFIFHILSTTMGRIMLLSFISGRINSFSYIVLIILLFTIKYFNEKRARKYGISLLGVNYNEISI